MAYMNSYAAKIVSTGGEGIMLRKPESSYENGRSHSVLKYKVQINSFIKNSVFFFENDYL